MPFEKEKESIRIIFGKGDIEVGPGLLEDGTKAVVCFTSREESAIGTRTNYSPYKRSTVEETPIRLEFDKSTSIDVVIRALLHAKGYLQTGSLEVELLESFSINDLVHAAHQNAIDKGWYSEPRSFGEVIALMHSELSEALEDHRNGHGFKEIWLEGDKPCGIPTELADTVIRIFDTCGHLGIDLEAAIAQKMAYNATRSVRHGGKKL